MRKRLEGAANLFTRMAFWGLGQHLLVTWEDGFEAFSGRCGEDSTRVSRIHKWFPIDLIGNAWHKVFGQQVWSWSSVQRDQSIGLHRKYRLSILRLLV